MEKGGTIINYISGTRKSGIGDAALDAQAQQELILMASSLQSEFYYILTAAYAIDELHKLGLTATQDQWNGFVDAIGDYYLRVAYYNTWENNYQVYVGKPKGGWARLAKKYAGSDNAGIGVFVLDDIIILSIILIVAATAWIINNIQSRRQASEANRAKLNDLITQYSGASGDPKLQAQLAKMMDAANASAPLSDFIGTLEKVGIVAGIIWAANEFGIFSSIKKSFNKKSSKPAVSGYHYHHHKKHSQRKHR